MHDALSLAAQHSQSGSIHFVFMDWRHASELLAAGEAVYSELKNHRLGQDSCWYGRFLPLARIDIRVQERRRDAPQQFSSWVNTDVIAPTFGITPGVNSFRTGRMDELSMHPTVKPIALVLTRCATARAGVTSSSILF